MRRRIATGSTGVGGSVGRYRTHGWSSEAFRLLARLREPIEFEAADERSVDLVFLLVPQPAWFGRVALAPRR